MSRDPRQDPRPGDVLMRSDKRTVLAADADHVTWRGNDQHIVTEPIVDWRLWSTTARVLTIATPKEP